jgi:hypothetical protein
MNAVHEARELETINDPELVAAIRRWEVLDAKAKSEYEKYQAMNPKSERRCPSDPEVRAWLRAECNWYDAIEPADGAWREWRAILDKRYQGLSVILDGSAYIVQTAAGDPDKYEVKVLRSGGSPSAHASTPPPANGVSQCQCGHDTATIDRIALGTSEPAVECDVTTQDGDATRDLIIKVRGSKQIRNAALASAIDEYLAATQNYNAVIDRHQREEEEIEARNSAAEGAVKGLIKELGGYAVHYRGIVWGRELIRDAEPGMPCILLEV